MIAKQSLRINVASRESTRAPVDPKVGNQARSALPRLIGEELAISRKQANGFSEARSIVTPARHRNVLTKQTRVNQLLKRVLRPILGVEQRENLLLGGATASEAPC